MRLAISNIAWDVAHDEAVAALLQQAGIDAIDVAPTKYFPVPGAAAAVDVARVRQWWRTRGIDITGMQSLLYGTSGLNLFGAPAVQAAMQRHLAAVCRIGAQLGATRLVFGSPRNRDRGDLNDAAALTVACQFLRELGARAASEGVTICLEPNPACYGANFMLDSASTAAVVRAVDHPAIRLQLDTGALTINGEDAAVAVARDAALIGHVHASEPALVALGEGSNCHAAAGAALARHRPDCVVSIEMLAGAPHTQLNAIERALAVAIRHYRPVKGTP